MDPVSTTAQRPPKSWEISTYILLAATAVTAIGSVVLAALYLYLYIRTATDGGSTIAVSSLPDAYPLLVGYAVLFIAFIAAQSWWSWSTRRMLLNVGITDRGVVRHWARTVSLILVILSYCCGLSQGYANPDPAHYDREQVLTSVETSAVSMTMRVLALGLLLFGTWVARAKVRQTVAVTRQWGDVTAPRTAPAVERPTATSGFWARAQALAAERGADLPVLETAHSSGRRVWRLVSADHLPAGIEPGSLVTVFPNPPQPGHAALEKPEPPGTEWFALIEDAGILHFRLLLPSQLPEWLAQARSAERWGLYRTDDPDALSTVIPYG